MAGLASGQALVVSATTGEMERLAELLHDYEIPFRFGSPTPAGISDTLLEEKSVLAPQGAGAQGAVLLLTGALPEGVAFPEAGLALYGNADLFEPAVAVRARIGRVARKGRAAAPAARSLAADLGDLEAGDYVVHVEHGIGRYLGLRTLEAGGVLVGSHAFAIYGNMLGVRWESEIARAHDVDIAAEHHVVIGVPNLRVDLLDKIVESELGFIVVPALDRRSPSTKFRIRGRQLSVDILTPMLDRASSKPVHLESLNVYAEPVRFLDYLLTDAQAAVVVAKAGLLVNVPSPARYALHKLVIAERRVAAFQTKAKKDLSQAEQLLQVLLRDRPGDLRVAWTAALEQPRKFMQQLRAGRAKLSAKTRGALTALTRNVGTKR